MPTWSEVLGNRPIRGEEALRVPGGLEPLHPPLPLAGGLMGVLCAVVEIPVLTVLHPRQNLPLGRAIAFEFIGDDHARDILTAFEEFTEELLGGLLIPTTLDENIQNVAVLIDRPPQVGAFFVDGDRYLIQMPLIAWAGPPAAELIRILLPELPAPLADGFVRHDDPTNEQDFFYIAMTEREAEIPPDGVADDLTWEPMLFIEIGRG
jgi:hypothetical protein